jgi:hypothetical protein
MPPLKVHANLDVAPFYVHPPPPPPTMSFWMEVNPKIYITKYAYISKALAPLVSTLAS